jgi:long-chain fatty acid transport protein
MSKKIFATVVISAFLISTAFATNGYFSHGYGTQYKSLAGAGVGLSLNSLGAATNPASIASLGPRVDVGASMFNPNRSYTVTGNPSGYPGTFGLAPGTVESGTTSFIVPSAGVNLSLPGNSSVGLAVYGNGGMNTDYEAATFGMNPTGVNLMQLFVGATYAKKVMDKHSIGVTGIFAWQSFEAKGLGAFGMFSSDATSLTDNDASTATGFGVRIGYLGDILPILSVGASYQSKINMGEFSEYAGLFAEQGDFDIPANWTVGIALKATPILTIVADMQQIMYSEIKSIANPMIPNIQAAQLGTEGGAGFGWQDMTVYKIGAQLSLIPGLTLRAGYSMTEQPVPAEDVMFNILAPGVVENHVTFGVTKSILPTIKLHLAIMRAMSNSVSGANPLEAPNQQTIELQMDQWDAEVGVSISL